MTKKATVKKAPIEVTRQSIRDALLGHAPKPEVELLVLFGVELELRQPTLGAILDAQDTEDTKTRSADMIIQFACVPGTDERVFEPADREMILNWPFGDDLMALQRAITKLSGVDVGDAEEALQTDPLKEQS